MLLIDMNRKSVFHVFLSIHRKYTKRQHDNIVSFETSIFFSLWKPYENKDVALVPGLI